jgi:hypothetical protein
MTSAEFAATYRVLKTLTEQGARSQIAQEVALGRMVMVHTLDVGSALDRQRLRAGVGSLQASAADQVLGVHDVDGTTTVVTRFLTTFTDLPSWIRDNALPDDAKTVVIAAVPAKPSEQFSAAAPTPATPTPTVPTPAAPTPSAPSFTAIFAPSAVASPDAPAPSPDAPAASPDAPAASPAAPSFSDVFGTVKPPQAAPPLPPPPTPAPPTFIPPAPQPGEFTRQFQASAPPAQHTPAAKENVAPPPSPAPLPPKAGESFTQIFGGMGAPAPAAASAPIPPRQAPLTPIPPAPTFQAPTPHAAIPSAPNPQAPTQRASTPPAPKPGGSFSEVFGKVSAPKPSHAAPPPSTLPGAPRFDAVIPPQLPEAPRPEPPAPPPRKPSSEFTQLFDRLTPGMSVPAQPRPQAPSPASPPSIAPAAPTPSWSQPAAPAAQTPPSPTWQSPVAPPSAPANAASPAPSGPSEFTRILGKVSIPEGGAGAPPRASSGAFSGAGLQMPQMPQMPQLPQIPQMQMPQAPQLPGMQLPQMQLPQVQLPAVGLTPLSVPQQAAGAGPSSTRSHLPLIIALNIVLIAAIGLVLYLVLKR